MWSFSPQDNVFLPFLPPGLPSFVFYHFQFLSYLKKENKTKTPTDLKAFHYYLFLTAVVLQKVKQMTFLILYFQRILAKPWCSLGTTNQGNLESLLTSWVHGSPLSLPWTEAGTGWGVLTPNAKQRPKVSEPGGGWGGMYTHGSLAATKSVSKLQIRCGFSILAHIAFAICYLCCRYGSLLSSYTTSFPKYEDNSSFENNLLNAHCSPDLCESTMTVHL